MLEDGYYWVKFKPRVATSVWRVCFCYGDKIIYNHGLYSVDTDTIEVKRTRLKEPSNVEDMPELKDTRRQTFAKPFINDIIYTPVKDLTKPLGHDMNKFVRNFYDSNV